MNMLFKNKEKRKIRRFYINIHKAMQIHVTMYPTNKKLFVTVQPKNTFQLELADHLWLPFLDQPQSNIVVFSIIIFQVYNIMVT